MAGRAPFMGRKNTSSGPADAQINLGINLGFNSDVTGGSLAPIHQEIQRLHSALQMLGKDASRLASNISRRQIPTGFGNFRTEYRTNVGGRISAADVRNIFGTAIADRTGRGNRTDINPGPNYVGRHSRLDDMGRDRSRAVYDAARKTAQTRAARQSMYDRLWMQMEDREQKELLNTAKQASQERIRRAKRLGINFDAGMGADMRSGIRDWAKTERDRKRATENLGKQQSRYQTAESRRLTQMGFTPAQIMGMGRASKFVTQQPFNPQHNDTFARTAVAFTGLYATQNLARTLFNNAQAGNIITTRLGQIAPLMGQGSAAGRATFRQRSKVLGLETGTNFQTQLTGFEKILEAGDDLTTDDVVRIQRKSAQISKVTGQDQGAITDVLMSAVLSSGMKGGQIDKFANMMFLSRTRGRIEFGEMQTSLGKVFASGKMAGFRGLEGPNGFNALMALTAASTLEGGSPSYNATQLAAYLERLSQPKSRKLLAARGVDMSQGPMQIIRQIAAKENLATQLGQPSFIAESQVFTSTRGSRGATVISSRINTVNDLLDDSVNKVAALEEAFETKMNKPEARLDKMASLASSFADALGQDAVRAVDDLTRPLSELVSITEKLNKTGKTMSPGGSATVKGLAGLGEIAALFPLISLLGSASTSLLGAEISPLSVGKKAGFGTRIHAGLANMFGPLSSLFAVATGQSNSQLIANRALAQEALNNNKGLPSAGIGVNPIGMGLLLAGGINWITQSAFEGYDAGLLAEQGKSQTKLEAISAAGLQTSGFRNQLNSIVANVRGKRIVPGQGKQDIIDALQSNSELMSRLNVEISDYHEGAEQTIKINGRVAKSFEEINSALQDVTKLDINKQIQLAFAENQVQSRLYESRRDLLNTKAAWNFSNFIPATIAGFNNDPQGVINKTTIAAMLGGPLGVLSAPWYAASSLPTNWLPDISGATAAELEEQKRVEAFDEWSKRLAAQQKAEEFAQSPEGQAQELRKKMDAVILASEDKLRSVQAEAKLQAELEGLSQKQVDERVKQAGIDANVSTQLELIQLGAEDWSTYLQWVADQTPEWKQQNEEIMKYQRDVADALSKWEEAIQSSDMAFSKLDKSLERADRTFELYNKKLEAQSAFKSAKIGVFEGLAGMMVGGLPSDVQPLAQALTANKFAQINLGASLTNFGDIAGSNAAEMDWIDAVLAERAMIRGKNLPDDFIGPNKANLLSLIKDYNNRTTAMSLTEKMQENGGKSWEQYLEWQSHLDDFDLDSMMLTRRKNELSQSTIDSFDMIGGDLVDLILGTGTINEILKNTKFSQDSRSSINAMMGGELGKNEFLRNPQEYLQKVLQNFPAELIADSPKASAISEFLGLLQTNGITNFADVLNLPDTDARKNQVLQGLYKLSKDASGVEQPLREAARVADGLSAMADESALLTSGFRDLKLELTDVVSLLGVYADQLRKDTEVASAALTTESVTAEQYETVLGQEIPVSALRPDGTVDPASEEMTRYRQKMEEEAALNSSASSAPSKKRDRRKRMGSNMGPMKSVSVTEELILAAAQKAKNDPEINRQITEGFEKACAATQSSILKTLGFDVGMNYLTGDLTKKLESSNAHKIFGDYGIGDVLFYKEKGPKGGPKHTAMYLGAEKDGRYKVVDQDGNIEYHSKDLFAYGYRPNYQDGAKPSDGGPPDFQLPGLFMFKNQADIDKFKSATDWFAVWAQKLIQADPFTTSLPAGVATVGAVTYLNAGKTKPMRVGKLTGLPKLLKYPGIGVTGSAQSGRWSKCNSCDGNTWISPSGEKQMFPSGVDPNNQGFTDTTVQAGTDLAGLAPVQYAPSESGGGGTTQPQIPGVGELIGVALANSVGAGIQTFFATLQAGGSTKEAIDAAFTTLASTVAQGISDAVGSSIGGIGGAIGGPLIGGLVGWGLSKLFGIGKRNTPPKERPQVSAWIENTEDFFKGNVLPESAYYQPMQGSHGQQIVQTKNQVYNFYDTPQLIPKVARATSDAELAIAYKRNR